MSSRWQPPRPPPPGPREVAEAALRQDLLSPLRRFAERDRAVATWMRRLEVSEFLRAALMAYGPSEAITRATRRFRISRATAYRRLNEVRS